jgi:Cysteine-rich CPXCG
MRFSRFSRNIVSSQADDAGDVSGRTKATGMTALFASPTALPCDARGFGYHRVVSSFYACPHCGETVDTSPDLGGGEEQDYVEDCTVCCRPNQIHASYDADEGTFSVEAEAE